MTAATMTTAAHDQAIDLADRWRRLATQEPQTDEERGMQVALLKCAADLESLAGEMDA